MEEIDKLGRNAYQKQMWGDYDTAVSMYTTAMKRYPNDARLLNNRCMCYLEMKDYARALDDAEKMIFLFPKNEKSFYRKGEVLMGLKKYLEAARAFEMVLQLDRNCEDANRSLLEARAIELSKRVKTTPKKILKALRMTNSIAEAEKMLKSGKLDAMLAEWENAVYYSDDETDIGDLQYDPLLDPNNPLGSTSLWVGNLTKESSEQTLKTLFAKYGQIKSMRVTVQYAFINYYDAAAPAKAMRNLQGTVLHGKNLVIKYPDSASGGAVKKSGKLK